MGTTRIKVIDLSGEKEQIKTSRKRAERLSSVAKIKEGKKTTKKAEEESRLQKLKDIKKRQEPKETTANQKTEEKISKPAVVKPKPQKTYLRGKRWQQAAVLIDRGRSYPAKEAIELLGKISTTRFDPTVEIHLNVTEKNLQGSVNLPYPISNKKEKKYLLFSNQKPKSVNEKLIWGNEKTVEEIATAKLKPHKNFDAVFATADFMPSLAKIAKILGPAGMMPNPKNGTVLKNVTEASERTQKTSFEYKTDPTTPVVHSKLGKLSDKPEVIGKNLDALVSSIGLNKIKKAILATTMSPGIKVDLSSITK